MSPKRWHDMPAVPFRIKRITRSAPVQWSPLGVRCDVYLIAAGTRGAFFRHVPGFYRQWAAG